MRAGVAALSLGAALAAPGAADAAWAEPPGEILAITSFTLKNAGQAFDKAATARPADSSRKVEVSTYVQYGLDETRTLILQPTWTRFETPYVRAEGLSTLSIGLRQRLLAEGPDVVSVQPLIRLPLANGERGNLLGQGEIEGEIRFLWGHGFDFDFDNPFGEHHEVAGFTVLEWAPRVAEGMDGSHIENDATLGFRVDGGDLVLVQLFNSWPLGGPHRRKHQIQPSAVTDLGAGVSVQTGVIYTYAGADVPVELGAVLGLWLRF